MKRLTFRTGLFLTADIVLLIICLFHIPTLLQRAQLPFELLEKDDRIFVDKILDEAASGDLEKGDVLLAMKGQRVPIYEVAEFLADFLPIKADVPVIYERSGRTGSTTVTLVPFYSSGHFIVTLLVGIVTWALGVFVLLKRRGELAASTLHWAMVSLGVSVIVTWGAISPDSVWTYGSRALFFISYGGVPTSFLFFTLIFPRYKVSSVAKNAWAIFLPIFALVAAMVYYHLRAIYSGSVEDYATFYGIFDVFYVFLFLYVGGGILSFVHSYATAGSTVERKKLKWILWGLVIGPTPFLLFSVLPERLFSTEFLPEEYTLVFLLVIPFAFAISFIKYHLLDIEVVINRTTAYGIVLGGLMILYTLVVILGAWIIGTNPEKLSLPVSVAAAIVLALLFDPCRRWVQRFVDRTFFRVRYYFREAQRKFVEAIKRSVDVVELAELIVSRLDDLFALQRVGFFTLKEPGDRIWLLAHRNYDLLATHRVRFEKEKLVSKLELPVALNEKIEPGVPFESADDQTFRRWGMAIVFPMVSERSEILGFLVLGEKKSGERFTAEDMLEQAEAQRLEELSRVKSFFVSSVSHDPKTPLTSIRMFAELLHSKKKVSPKKSREYLEIIEGESERLTRLINNVLDFSKVERGVKEYNFSEAKLNEMVRVALRTVGYQVKLQKFALRVQFSKKDHVIRADPDAVVDAITNILSNAIKYSTERKYIAVSTFVRNDFAGVRVEDRGIGISPDGLKHIFDPFHRLKDEKSRGVGGVGLGLALVRHVMDAHGGTVEVKSAPGKGSAFTLSFPLKDTQSRRR